MSFRILLLIVLLVNYSCNKLDNNAAQFFGKWRCEGIVFGPTDLSTCIQEPCLYPIIPYSNCHLEITTSHVVFYNQENTLKLRVQEYTLDKETNSIEIITLDRKGQKRVLNFTREQDDLVGSFFSLNGFVSDADYIPLGQEYFGESVYYYNHFYTRK